MGNKYHIWEKIEITLKSNKQYENPYLDVDVWVDLVGPGFNKRVYGFWDGENTFKVRITATVPGMWAYKSGANVEDTGLVGVEGNFEALAWLNTEIKENELRKGFIFATENKHAFMHADGSPFLLLGDTWWATPTYRFPWYDDDIERDFGPDMGFKDMVKYRKKQGFNCIAMIAAFPTWANDDGFPSILVMDDEKKTAIRAAWQEDGSSSSDASHRFLSAKPMHNEGGRAFKFPGKVEGYENVVPDFDKINPEYFKHMDKKIDYLNSQGFVPFIEVSRRDMSQVWSKYYNHTESYGRYIQYIYSRYQANNCLFSPIHFDYVGYAIPSREFNKPANWVVDKYGVPPFGTLQGTNSAPSSLANFGNSDEAKWLTFHQIGNSREHHYYWYLTEIFYNSETKPAINGEPYYSGHPESLPEKMGKDGKMYRPGLHADGIEAGTQEDNLNCRSGFYGSFLSGALGGIIYGAEGLWSANIEEGTVYKIWDALKFSSSDQFPYLKNFARVQGDRYIDLRPSADMLTPNKSRLDHAYRGWSYCATTKEKDFILLYFEKDCNKTTIRGLIPNREYTFKWFNPREGQWMQENTQILQSGVIGRVVLPEFPEDNDFGACLTLNS